MILLIAGQTIVVALAAVATAPPAAAAFCGDNQVSLCNSTLTTSNVTAPTGSTVSIHFQAALNSGSLDDQCIELTADSATTTLGLTTPPDTTTNSNGALTWDVTDTNAETVTYTAFYQGSSSANSCPPFTAPVMEAIVQQVQIIWVSTSEQVNSTVTATPTTVIADGQGVSAVTVVLNDANGFALSNHMVHVTPSPGNSAQVLPPEELTGTGGQALFTVSDATPENLTLTAQDLTTPSGVSQMAHVNFVPSGSNELVDSSVKTSLNRVPADGLSTTTVTVTLADANGPLAGHTVTLAPSGGGSVVTAQTDPTNALGQATFTISDTTQESVTFTAQDDQSSLGSSCGPTCVAVGLTVIRFGDLAFGELGGSALSLSPSGTVFTSAMVPDDGSTAAAVFVQLACNDSQAKGCAGAGNLLFEPNQGGPIGTVPGATVALVATGSNSAVVSSYLDPTNFEGEARFHVTDTVPETVTYNAVDVTNNLTLASVDPTTTPPSITPLKVVITFIGPGTPSPTASTAVAAPSTVAADGVTTSTVTVTLRDNHGILVPGRVVTLSPGRGHATFSPAQATSDSHGVAVFTTIDTTVETVSYLVTDVTDSVALTQFPQVTFSAGAPSQATSTVFAAPPSVPAGGASAATVTVTVTDQNSNPIPGKSVSLAALAGSSTISNPSGPTNTKGITTFTVTDAVPESVTYVATDATDSFVLSHTARVAFTGPATTANSATAANPSSVPANSLALSTVTVTLRDLNNNPVPGKLVTLRPNGGAAAVSPTTPGSDTSNQNGVASFTTSDGTPETVTYTPTDLTDSVTLPMTKVSFTGPPSGANSTVGASPAKVPADGTSASQLTVTVVDSVGQPIPGQIVSVGQSSGASSSINPTAPGSAITNGAGQALFSVTDSRAETVTYSATDTSVSPSQKLFATAQVTFTPITPHPAVTSISPAFGPPGGGIKVTISGQNLIGATAVHFGTQLATNLAAAKGGTLTATAPAGVGTVDVTVTTPGGTSPASVGDQFHYGPAVTGVSPSMGSHLGGTKVTISGTNLSGVTTVFFGTTAVTKFSRISATTIVLISPPGLGTVDITVTTPGGTSALVGADRFTYT